MNKTTEVQAFLQELAEAKGATYAAVQRHTCEDGRVFFTASAHRNWLAQTANGDTLAGAVEKLMARDDWFDASPKQEAA